MIAIVGLRDISILSMTLQGSVVRSRPVICFEECSDPALGFVRQKKVDESAGFHPGRRLEIETKQALGRDFSDHATRNARVSQGLSIELHRPGWTVAPD